MPAFFRKGKKYAPSALRNGGPEGIIVEFNSMRPLLHANRTLDTGEWIPAGYPDLPVFGFKPGNAGAGDVKWFFFRHEANARQFQRDVLVARLSD